MKSLNKALDVLEVFINSESEELRLVDIVKITGLNRPIVNRIVSVLAERGYLNQKEKWGKYTLGSKFLIYHGTMQRKLKLRDIAMPYLLKLSQNINETVILATWDGRLAFYREIINSAHPLNLTPEEGTVIALHCTSIGKIILANKTPEELKIYLADNELKQYTRHTITDKDTLISHLKHIVTENVAYDDEEYFLGARGVASGIYDDEGAIIGCVGVFGPDVRLSMSRMLEMAPAVKKCAEDISKVMGYQAPVASRRDFPFRGSRYES